MERAALPVYRAILFDVYGTLLNVHAVSTQAEKLFPGRGEQLSVEWRRKQIEYTWLRNMAGRHVDFRRVTEDALDYALEALQLQSSAAPREALMDAYTKLPAFPDALVVLADLSPKPFPLAVLSNGTPAMLELALAAAGLAPFFSEVLSVEAAGRFKIDPQVYQLAIDRFGGAPSDFLLVSSNGWDIAGAAMFGFATFWVNRAGAPIERMDVAPTAIGRSLADLPPWLGR